MPSDDLNDPLGEHIVDAKPVAPSRLPMMFAVLGVTVAIGVLVWRVAGVAPRGAVATITIAPKRIVVAPPPAATDVTASIAPHKHRFDGEEIEAKSGVKVVRQGSGLAPGALIITVPPRLGVQLASAPDRRLTEKGFFGPLPKIATNGDRPADIYARPLITSGKLPSGAPKVALVVGGLGLNEAFTQMAISQLPSEVTLGFAPYGSDLQHQVNLAREAGHEVILQVPMEPFDYPQNNPGPHMLASSATVAQNLDDLHWLMSRFSGYVGIENFLGARFTANSEALMPVLRDIAGRGLLYLDDGASPQSLAIDLGATIGLQMRRADVVVDGNPQMEAMSAAFLKLETRARVDGIAVGVASALPRSIARTAAFAKSLEQRGIALVPLSAVALRLEKPVATRQ